MKKSKMLGVFLLIGLSSTVSTLMFSRTAYQMGVKSGAEDYQHYLKMVIANPKYYQLKKGQLNSEVLEVIESQPNLYNFIKSKSQNVKMSILTHED